MQPMEVDAPSPAQTVSPPPVAAAAGTASVPKTRAARRKTLVDITNLSIRLPGESAFPAPLPVVGADGVDGIEQLRKENADLLRLLAERDEASETEIEKLRISNWEFARTNSQMMAELNLGRNRLKVLQHELACSRAALKAKTSELEDAKKAIQRRNAPIPPVQRTQHVKDADVVDREPTSDASHAGSIKRPGNTSRKRMLRSRSLGPVASTKLALPKDRETSQRRKSMRMPQPSSRSEDLLEIEDVQLAISSCKIDPESVPASESRGHPFLRRSSLGRPPRQARERVTSYKEMPLHVKLRRP